MHPAQLGPSRTNAIELLVLYAPNNVLYYKLCMLLLWLLHKHHLQTSTNNYLATLGFPKWLAGDVGDNLLSYWSQQSTSCQPISPNGLDDCWLNWRWLQYLLCSFGPFCPYFNTFASKKAHHRACRQHTAAAQPSHNRNLKWFFSCHCIFLRQK